MHPLFDKIDNALKTVLGTAIISASLSTPVYTMVNMANSDAELPCVKVYSLFGQEMFENSEDWKIKTVVVMEFAKQEGYTTDMQTLGATLTYTLKDTTGIIAALNATAADLNVMAIFSDNIQREIDDDTFKWSMTLDIQVSLKP